MDEDLIDTAPPALLPALAAAPCPGSAAHGGTASGTGCSTSSGLLPPAGPQGQEVNLWGSPGLQPRPMSLCAHLLPSGLEGWVLRRSSTWHGGMAPIPHHFWGKGFGVGFGVPQLQQQLILVLCPVPHRTSSLDGHRQLCPELLPSAQRGPRCVPCPQPHQGQAGCPPAWWHLGPSAPWSRSASSPAPSSFAPTKRAGTRSAFLSRNDGFLAKSCSSVAVTTLPQFPSKDVFLCCDRDAGRAPGRRPRACGCTTGARGSCHQRPGPGAAPGDTSTAPALGQPHGRAPRSTTAP